MAIKIKSKFSFYIHFTLILLIISYSGCNLWYGEDLTSRNFYSDKDFTYLPIKDTFYTNDTLWLHFSFPNHLVNDNFDVTLDKDSFECELFPFLCEIKTLNDSVFYNYTSIIDKYPIMIKKGSKANNAIRYFFKKNSNNLYILEFGFVLNRSGKFIIGRGIDAKDFSIQINNIPGLGSYKEGPGEAAFFSTFRTTGKGYFQFEVIDRK